VLDIDAGGLDAQKPIVGSAQWVHAYSHNHPEFTEIWA
jgi:hypothetical protein